MGSGSAIGYSMTPPTQQSPPTQTDATDCTESVTARRLQSLINELSTEFISILDLDELIDRVASRLREVIDYKFFNLFLVDEKRGGLVWKKSVGFKPDEMAAYELIPFDRSIASAAVREGQTITVADVNLDRAISRYRRRMRRSHAPRLPFR
ncbi:MAG: GAF domain-containing protein [Acidobacteria bacterium]|nr:GAF domain-containing protein [Acidobacteriota bacterium]